MPAIMQDEYYLALYIGCREILKFPQVAGPGLVAWAQRELAYIRAITDWNHRLREKVELLSSVTE